MHCESSDTLDLDRGSLAKLCTYARTGPNHICKNRPQSPITLLLCDEILVGGVTLNSGTHTGRGRGRERVKDW